MFIQPSTWEIADNPEISSGRAFQYELILTISNDIGGQHYNILIYYTTILSEYDSIGIVYSGGVTLTGIHIQMI